ncbi:hypothetical protein [Rhizobium sp. AAP43]|uniref:hypothetical protein n=1 Tax=Rhizobium sp. AAP43 TaxID=1523420 RepID=UPI0006B8B48F|nr:hypothetical protein [Rhizobium sp. AAP43]KPF46550.1 hypothetical protein IP76_04435 [Rhizobium sp. AAP43]
MTEHAKSATVAFTFSGRLEPNSFTAFAEHRAARLALLLDIATCDRDHCRLAISGPEALIDAFEMATSLGPYDCIVLDVSRTSLDQDLPEKAVS